MALILISSAIDMCIWGHFSTPLELATRLVRIFSFTGDTIVVYQNVKQKASTKCIYLQLFQLVNLI